MALTGGRSSMSRHDELMAAQANPSGVELMPRIALDQRAILAQFIEALMTYIEYPEWYYYNNEDPGSRSQQPCFSEEKDGSIYCLIMSGRGTHRYSAMRVNNVVLVDTGVRTFAVDDTGLGIKEALEPTFQSLLYMFNRSPSEKSSIGLRAVSF
ncbi:MULTISPECIES: hypothetical protein [Sorangium]|uniref:hypothetical protein n=1 Tax=Sorangium TaxID=39643 RepID=UPI003D9C3F28